MGLRFGDNNGVGYEFSYQRKLSSDNRLEANLGIRNNDNLNFIKAIGLYQIVWELDGNFNWYAGYGGGLGSWSYNDKFKKNFPGYDASAGGAFLLLAGVVGVEYDFDIPLLIAIDFRPEIVLNNGFGKNYGSDIGLSLRYQF